MQEHPDTSVRLAPRAYRVAQVKQVIPLSEREIRKLIASGDLAPIIRTGRVVLVPSTTIDAWLAKHTVTAE